MAQKTRSHARVCLLGVKNVEINNEPLLCPQTSIFGKKVDFWLKFLAENALQWRRSGVNVIVAT